MSRWSRARPVLPVVFALLLLALVLPVGAVWADQHLQTGESDLPALDNGTTTFLLELDTDGDAQWHITEEMNVTDSDDVAAFETVADDFESRQFELDAVIAFENAMRAVAETVDRPMEFVDGDRTASLEGDGANQTGTLTASFTWENFTRVEGDEMYIDDVLETDVGHWFSGLTADQELHVRPPDGYAVLDASVPVQNGELRWRGPQDFEDDALVVTFIGDGDVPGDNGTSASVLLLGGGLLLVVVAIVAGVRYRDRVAAVFARQADESREPSDPPRDPATEPTDQTGTPPVRDDGLDEELLSDEERVERLLERNNGRMKQAQIVTETDWSNAKVSQLLSAMAEDDRIDKLRIGRENLITLPEVDVTDSDDSS